MMMTMDKRRVLDTLDFGKRIAEEEVGELSAYFVETTQWRKIWAGEIDVVYGTKGAGKSAIYTLLSARAEELRARGVLVITAENPRGTPIFRDLVADAPASASQFSALWKLYFLSLLAQALRDQGRQDDATKRVVRAVENAGLLPKEKSLKSVLRAALDYVRAISKIEAFEHSVQIDAMGTSTFAHRIMIREPSSAEKGLGYESVDTLLQLANAAYEACDTHVWLLLDRLDVAFADSLALEQNALQALFHVYLDFQAYDHIFVKIFLRSDIWQRITTRGFREASHITRSLTITWDDDALLNLVVRRSLRNPALRELYGVDDGEGILGAQKQLQLFYRIFPEKVDRGAKSPKTLDWILSRTCDGSGRTAPRELIHLLSSIRDTQLRLLEVGGEEPEGDALFDRTAIRKALPDVSQVRLEQTLYAEYPDLKVWIEKLEREKTQQTLETLAKIWGIRPARALTVANQLTEIGFFERRGAKDAPVFWAPFLYRDALAMVQGAASDHR